MLKIENFSGKIKAESKDVFKNIDLEVEPKEIHLIMGPNGAGKSSFARALLNHPSLEITGEISLDGVNITDLETDERAKQGLFLANQSPVEIPNIQLTWFIKNALDAKTYNKNNLSVLEFLDEFKKYSNLLGLGDDFSNRNVNEGFSGGEKKKSEILQMLLIKPKYAILDEIDSGLDLEALKKIFAAIQSFVEEANSGIIIISHNPNILEYIKPDFVHLMRDGELVESGDRKLAERIITEGYGKVTKS